MHTEGVHYEKGKMAPLYLNKAAVGTNKDLLPTFNILLRMFRCNIAPQAGNVDAIRGGLVNLLLTPMRFLKPVSIAKGMRLM